MAREDGAQAARRKWGKRGFRSAAEAAAPMLSGPAAKRGFAERRLLSEWPAIAGPVLAPLCRPVKMRFRRGEGAFGATLVVEAEGPRALEVQHLADVIVERANAVYGYRAVARLHVVQTPARGGDAPSAARGGDALSAARGGDAPALAEAPAAFAGPPRLDREPSPDISGVEDDRLRGALARLEANIRARRARAADRKTGADR